MTPWAQVIGGMVFSPVRADPAMVYTQEWLEENPPFSVVPDCDVTGAPLRHNATAMGEAYTNPQAGPVFNQPGE